MATARWASMAACLVISGSSWAEAQVTLSYEANAASLGAIPKDGVSSFECGTPRLVAFDIPDAQAMAVSTVAVSFAVTDSNSYGLLAELVEPGGTAFPLFARTSDGSRSGTRMAGVYGFADDAAGNLWQATTATGNGGVIPPGTFRTSAAGGAVTTMNPAFAGKPWQGRWTLRIRYCWSLGVSGAVTAATLTLSGSQLAAATATPGTLGTIPDGPSASAQTPGPPRDVAFTIALGRGRVQRVRVSATMTHPYVGDLVARLIAPTGQTHVLFGYTGATTATSPGSLSGLNGTYEFRDGPLLGDWWATAEVDTTIVPNVYTTSALGGPGSTGAVTSMDAAFANVASAGTWTLRLTDGYLNYVGAISAASLTLETIPAPTTFADSYSAAYATPLTIAAPGVLANDSNSLGGAVSAALVTGPSRGTLTLASSGAFTYTPSGGFVGTDGFTYRAINAAGPGDVTTVSIAVAAPTTVQPPTELRASSMAGNQVTLRWIPAALGPGASDFVIEGGVAPGQVLGGFAVGGPLPIFTFVAPTGAFFLRVHAIDGAGQRSDASNEIRVFVNTPTPPSAATALTAMGNGDSFALSWQHTFAGGAPSGGVLDVTGSATASLPLPLTETFTLGGVPAGTYTFRVRATNASGASTASTPVTVTLPAACSGAPAPPANVLAYAVGRVVHLAWDPPAAGSAPASYVLHVGGAFTGAFPLPVRNFSSPAPPGSYALSLSAVNPCGSSAQTPPQTVFVP